MPAASARTWAGAGTRSKTALPRPPGRRFRRATPGGALGTSAIRPGETPKLAAGLERCAGKQLAQNKIELADLARGWGGLRQLAAGRHGRQAGKGSVGKFSSFAAIRGGASEILTSATSMPSPEVPDIRPRTRRARWRGELIGGHAKNGR